jgi:hypothetical protein
MASNIRTDSSPTAEAQDTLLDTIFRHLLPRHSAAVHYGILGLGDHHSHSLMLGAKPT